MTTYTLPGTNDAGRLCSLDELSKLFAKKIEGELHIWDKLKTIESQVSGFQKRLISFLHSNLSSIITASPTKLHDLATNISFHYRLPASTKHNDLMEDIYKAFSYDRFRESDIAPWLVRGLNVKTCLYCNTAFTLVAERDGILDDTKALLQFDHFYPKSRYPYLSMSFFNLLPVCGNCNLLLSDRSKTVHPYLTPLDDLFTVSLTNTSLVQCKLNPNVMPVVDVQLKAVAHKTIFDCLAIKSRYSHFADIGQEIVWRQSVYTNEYLAELRSTLKGMSFTSDQANRFILGNYCNPSEYHKRPLTKFYADVGKQLGLV